MYRNRACQAQTNQNIIQLLTEGLGIRSIGRILDISVTTVIDRIRRIAHAVNKSYSYSRNGIYEIDELWTYIGKKSEDVWISYIWDRKNKAIVDFKVGSRTKDNLRELTQVVMSLNPLKVCTDGLISYKSLLPQSIHKVGLPHTRHIERNNLTLRTHLKRLSRKTICFSRSKEMLEACLKIYFWSDRIRTNPSKSPQSLL